MSHPRAALFGATSDIATAVARHYAEHGWNLLLVGRDAPALTALAADLDIRGASATEVLVADLADIASLAGVTATAWQRFGGLDVALVAHGTTTRQDEAEQDAGVAADILSVNFLSAALLLNELARPFAASRAGTIAAISSVAGDRGRASNYVYGAAKSGLQTFLEGLRHRLATSGVAVVDIRPGFVITRLTVHRVRTGPLWATPERVAADIIRAVARRQPVCYTPWFWRGIMLVVRNLPRPVFHRTSF